MAKTITFSFSSAEFKGTEATETFTFEELNIDEKMDMQAFEKEVHRLFEVWVWHKLNISSSIITEGLDIVE